MVPLCCTYVGADWAGIGSMIAGIFGMNTPGAIIHEFILVTVLIITFVILSSAIVMCVLFGSPSYSRILHSIRRARVDAGDVSPLTRDRGHTHLATVDEVRMNHETRANKWLARVRSPPPASGSWWSKKSGASSIRWGFSLKRNPGPLSVKGAAVPESQRAKSNSEA